jgi:hypothetical protein
MLVEAKDKVRKSRSSPNLEHCTIYIDDDIKDFTCGQHNYYTNQKLVFGGYVKVQIFVYPSYFLGQYHFEPY